MDKSQQEHLR